jgi:hypothetical protein
MTFLKSLQQLPQSHNQISLQAWMADVRDQTHTFLVPFLQYPDSSAGGKTWSRKSALFKDTYSLCRFHHTRLLDPDEGIALGPEEELLKWAVEETMGGICSVLVDVGLSVEGIWQSNFNLPRSNNTAIPSRGKLAKEVKRWTEGVEELMSWLGWAGEWIGCDVLCTWNEKCYIPMWPIIPMGRRGPGWGRGRPGYGRLRRPPPGSYPYPGDPYSGPGVPPNGTWRGPGRGFNPWGPSEAELWKPKCVKKNFIFEGDED